MAIGRSFGSAIDDHRAIDDHQACDTLGPRFPLVLAIGDHLGATEHTRRVARERRAVVGSEVEWKPKRPGLRGRRQPALRELGHEPHAAAFSDNLREDALFGSVTPGEERK
jgi:hypothetical protein